MSPLLSIIHNFSHFQHKSVILQKQLNKSSSHKCNKLGRPLDAGSRFHQLPLTPTLTKYPINAQSNFVTVQRTALSPSCPHDTP